MKAGHTGERASITIRIPKSLMAAIRKSAVADRRSINEQMVVLLETAQKRRKL